MASSRPKLTLDEHSFQEMLAAAFTIQEHNTQRKRILQPPQDTCSQCGAPAKDGQRLCDRCSGEGLRPGEQLQRNWASLWMMSQEQGNWPDRESAAQIDEVSRVRTTTAEVPTPQFSDALEHSDWDDEIANRDEDESEREWADDALVSLNSAAPEQALISDVEFSPDALIGRHPTVPWGVRDIRLKLRFHRADVYLVLAIVVSTFAMVWVLSATPAAGVHRKPHLRSWEKALVSLGLAEAPEPQPRRGDPNIPVWVDPKTALYYCAGEQEYGKTPGGHLATQREAQIDQFQPAGRAACE